MNKTHSLLLVVVIMLAGCQNIDTSQLAAPYKVSLYIRGKEIKAVDVPQNSDLEKMITVFLENNQTGWKPSFVTYAPGIMVYGDNFSLLLDDNGPVLNCWQDKGKNFQGTKSSSSELRALKQRVVTFINAGS